jgi:hypothetical protein
MKRAVLGVAAVSRVAARPAPILDPMLPTGNTDHEQVSRHGLVEAKALDWSVVGIDWTKPPRPFPRPSSYRPSERFELANGVAVYLVENHRLPLVSVRISTAPPATARRRSVPAWRR